VRSRDMEQRHVQQDDVVLRGQRCRVSSGADRPVQSLHVDRARDSSGEHPVEANEVSSAQPASGAQQASVARSPVGQHHTLRVRCRSRRVHDLRDVIRLNVHYMQRSTRHEQDGNSTHKGAVFVIIIVIVNAIIHRQPTNRDGGEMDG
jgi:hypothetical protein